TGVEAQADRRELKHLLDLPRRLDPGACLVVEGWLVLALAAQLNRHLDPFGELLPRVAVEPKRAVRCGLARPRSAAVAADVGHGRFRLESVIALGGIEHVEPRTQFREGA